MPSNESNSDRTNEFSQTYHAMRNTLAAIHELLVKHDAPQQRYTLAAISAIDRHDGAKVFEIVSGLEFSGGAGSINDLILFQTPWSPEYYVDDQDQASLRRLLASLKNEIVALER